MQCASSAIGIRYRRGRNSSYAGTTQDAPPEAQPARALTRVFRAKGASPDPDRQETPSASRQRRWDGVLAPEPLVVAVAPEDLAFAALSNRPFSAAMIGNDRIRMIATIQRLMRAFASSDAPSFMAFSVMASKDQRRKNHRVPMRVSKSL